MFATAISNNDMVYLYWHVGKKIPGCLGFSVIRHDASDHAGGRGTPLPAMVGFPKDKTAAEKFKNTDEWPVQKFAWKDVYAPRGGSYWYEIVPMSGKPDHLTPAMDRAMRTRTVTLAPGRGDCSVFFNRGIISTQAIARKLPKTKKGVPSSAKLQERIVQPGDSIRIRLAGDIIDGVLSLIKRAEDKGGECYCALYELHDEELVGALKELGAKGRGKKARLHIILSNAGKEDAKDTEEGTGDGDKTNEEAREELHELKIDVTDRMLIQARHIGHNKFVVYVDKRGKAQAVLTGSTNWTSTGLCAQSNNAILLESPALAEKYLDYWKALKADTEEANGDPSDLQADQFRSANEKTKGKKRHVLKDAEGKPSGDVRVWFSPNMPQQSVPKKKDKDGNAVQPETPPDLAEVFERIENAKQGALFLAFIPGKWSIVSKLRAVYDARRDAGQLFYLRGAATSPDPASAFRVDLYHRSSRSDATVRGVEHPPDAGPSAGVASVAGIFASFAKWEAELYKLGHAVIHDKIVVLDPFTDDSVVITGSHNLGFKASYANDENLLVIRNDRAVAEAYAAHVLDVYEHYRWRWRIQQPIRDKFQVLLKHKKKGETSAALWQKAVQQVGPTVMHTAWHELKTDDGWQDYYENHKDLLASEVNFWSPFGGVSLSEDMAPPTPPARPGRRQPSRGRRETRP